jgi:copper chaperone NosL
MRRALVVLLVVLSACSTAASGADRPPNVEIGRDICERCGMIIEDERFASGYTRPDGTDAVFDDIGGMLDWASFTDALDRPMWVHDYRSLDWIRASTATFVRGGVDTPMGFSIAAFASVDAARAHAQEHGGEVLGWSELLSLAREGSLAWTPTDDQPSEHDH